MKGEQVYLDELSPSTKGYKVKVKVIEKGRAQKSPVKKVVYQNLLLQDDKGNKMRGSLFGDQVESYKEAFVYHGVYEISNAPIKKCSDEWRSAADELDFQMSFGKQTVIEPVASEVQSFAPNYLTIAQIPKSGSSGEKYDVLGVVLFMELTPKTVITSRNKEVLVREIIVVDHSAPMPITISAWSDLAGDECDALVTWPDKSCIVGFTAVRVASHKGFSSLATTMSTTIVKDPTGDRVKALRDWALQHEDSLSYTQSRVLEVREPSEERVITTIYSLKLKKAVDTMVEDRRWLRAKILDSGLDKVHVYIGCSRCNTTTSVPVGTTYACSNCSRKGCVASIRATFNCEITDATGSLQVAMFTNECETLFKMSAAAISAMKQSDDQGQFQKIQNFLATTDALIQMGPTMALARSRVLQWVPRKVVLEELEGSSEHSSGHLVSSSDLEEANKIGAADSLTDLKRQPATIK